MSRIKLFAEFHSGRRRPCIDLSLNGQSLTYDIEYAERTSPECENIVLVADGHLKDLNIFCATMKDKTDLDLIITDEKTIDHYIVIREIEIDGIRLESILHECCKFEHAMSPEWVSHMQSRGYDIQPIYENSLHMRLNGTWSMTFQSPIWLWHTRKMAREI